MCHTLLCAVLCNFVRIKKSVSKGYAIWFSLLSLSPSFYYSYWRQGTSTCSLITVIIVPNMEPDVFLVTRKPWLIIFPKHNQISDKYTKWWGQKERAFLVPSKWKYVPNTVTKTATATPRDWKSKNLPWQVPKYSLIECLAASQKHYLKSPEKGSLCRRGLGRSHIAPSRNCWGLWKTITDSLYFIQGLLVC